MVKRAKMGINGQICTEKAKKSTENMAALFETEI